MINELRKLFEDFITDTVYIAKYISTNSQKFFILFKKETKLFFKDDPLNKMLLIWIIVFLLMSKVI